MKYITKNLFSLSFILFLSVNMFLYLFTFLFHGKLPLNAYNDFYNAHHYKQDTRVEHKPFSFLNALGQYDAQWYLMIADRGYPFHPKTFAMGNKKSMDGLSYAFFPLYPLTLALLNLPLKHIELAAFIYANIFLIINFFSMYFVLTKLYAKTLAVKTIFLLFLFPFSIFYRSYFTEGLYLFLLIWFAWGFIKKKYVLASVLLGLLLVTKANGFLLNIFFVLYLLKQARKYTLSYKRILLLCIPMIVPICLWIGFCFYQTGNPLYFLKVRSAWFSLGVLSPFTLIYNMLLILNFFHLPFHDFHYSQIDCIMILLIGVCLIKAYKKMKGIFWWIAFALYLSPLLVTDTMSFSRYQSVSFPIFLYLAMKLPNFWYWITLIVFAISLFVVSLYFVNWYWVG